MKYIYFMNVFPCHRRHMRKYFSSYIIQGGLVRGDKGSNHLTLPFGTCRGGAKNIFLVISPQVQYSIVHVKGTVQPWFLTSSFFHHLNQPGPLTNGLKEFCFWFRFSLDIWIFMKLLLRGVKFCTLSYCAESFDFSVSYLKGQSNEIFDLFFS